MTDIAEKHFYCISKKIRIFPSRFSPRITKEQFDASNYGTGHLHNVNVDIRACNCMH